MQHCQFCGAELSKQARFCRNCGRFVPTLLGRQSDTGGSSAINVQSQAAPTFISDSSLPTDMSERSEQQGNAATWGWANDQDVPNRQLPGDRQTDESQSMVVEPFFPGGPAVPGSPAPGHVPIVQGTPQVYGVPTVRGTPSIASGSPPAASTPPPMPNAAPPAHGLGHGAATSAPSPSVPPSASPQPEHYWRVQTPQTHPLSHPSRTVTVPHRQRSLRHKLRSRSKQLKLDKAVDKIVSYLLALSKLKNAKALLFLILILLVLGGSGGVLLLDEKLEPNNSSVGFLGFDESLERQFKEGITKDKAHAIATAYTIAATGTAAALQHPFPRVGAPVLNDPLSSNSTYKWIDGYYSHTGTACIYKNGTYHVVESNTNRFYYCIASNTSFSNFVYQVEMTFIQGSHGGILFRSQGKRHYYFSIGRDGKYNLQLYIDDTGPNSRRLAFGHSAAINTGLNQPNLIAVVARSDSIDLYVNQQYLTSVRDSSYGQGQIGLAAEDEGGPADVMFTNARVWVL